MRKHVLLLVDIAWLCASPIIAIIINNNLELSTEKLEQIKSYLAFCAIIGVIVFPMARVHRGLWRYATVQDVVRVVIASTATIITSLFTAIGLHRFEGVSPSFPIIQWLVIVCGLCGTRAAARIVREMRSRKRHTNNVAVPSLARRNVLVIGLTSVTELYLRAVTEYASDWLSVVGILADEPKLHGRELKSHTILGTSGELLKILRQYETHGVEIHQIVVTVPARSLSQDVRDNLNEAKRMGIKLDSMEKLLDLVSAAPRPSYQANSVGHSAPIRTNRVYRRLKRGLDFTAAVFLAVISVPIICVVAVVVLLDVGHPVLFWQQRPGRLGKRFKLYKFRTMRPSHDGAGMRIPDEHRSSWIGAMLRRTRLDELPQLYNILAGHMSFVGPRPLLAAEQKDVRLERLSVRPGLTGWAQVNGGREVSIEEKTALDMWYVKRMSPTLDAAIMLRTIRVLLDGDQRNAAEIQAALEELTH